VVITNMVTIDAESNWLEGSMLLAVYALLGLFFFYHP
jgi:Ca2+:H+ antiporter